MDGIEVDELSPSPFLWFRLRKKIFKEVVLLDVNLGTLSYCKKQGDGVIKTAIKY